MEVSVEGSRQTALDMGGGLPREKRLSFGIGSSWSSGGDDFALGVAVERLARAQPDILTGRPHLRDDKLVMGVDWVHDGWLRLDLNWQQENAGRAFDGPTRMVDIASGAPLREAGMHMALTFQPRGAGALRFGIEAQDARVARDDLLWIGTAARQDVRIGLFARARF
jgi:hypothetical protein